MYTGCIESKEEERSKIICFQCRSSALYAIPEAMTMRCWPVTYFLARNVERGDVALVSFGHAYIEYHVPHVNILIHGISFIK